jgi:putative tricarboxylic transport membrane protein
MTNKIVYAARKAYLVAAWLFVAAVISQVFLAGLSLFASAANWDTHKEFGYSLGFLALLLVVLAFAGRIPRTIGRWLALLLAVYAIQTILPNLRRDAPWIAALHPVNALAIFWIALTHARRALVELVMPQPGSSIKQAAQGRPVKV